MTPQQAPVAERILKSSTGRTCRVHERLGCDLPSACQPTSAFGRKDARWRATIHDISISGVSLLVARRFEPGAGLAVELPGTDGKEGYIVLAKVTRASLMTGGSWMLGCKFISELSEDEVERLFAPAPAADSSSESQTEEVSEPIAPSQQTDAAPPTLPQKDVAKRQVLVDVHFHLETRPGVFIRSLIKQLDVPQTWPLTPGQNLTLWGDPENGPRPLFRVVVVGCGQQAEQWRVQCRLLDPINSDLLAALGRFARKQ